ncbi:Transposable element Tc3 transposase [Araneus ventricosus]|uniref:Transposable element Tc3 transposase n=1 Tax=Araneus ventricosus TaxID=182803 RepID=A0A4Y2AIU0_ARAVE|nr:Transposable element Tc3 transposase [Araneus ventricosus]
MIYRVLTRKKPYEPKPRSARPRVTDIRSDRRIQRMASSQKMSVHEITRTSQLQISKNTVHRRIIESVYMIHAKMAPRLPLSNLHISERLQRVRNHVSYGDKWMTLLFSDEKKKKKMELDGPEGNIKYWHDLRKEPRSFFSRQSGGGSVMVWAAFGFNGQVGLALLDGRQNSPKYIETLENHLMPFSENIGRQNWEYQHDNAPTHISSATKNYLNSKNVTVLEWPPMIPDLNPIENEWGIMSRKVYENGRQFYSVYALKRATESAWYNLEPEILQTLIISMEKTCIRCLTEKWKDY